MFRDNFGIAQMDVVLAFYFDHFMILKYKRGGSCWELLSCKTWKF